jgi:7-cyano-7-deazaguanine synthase in queuosine biosynthesis
MLNGISILFSGGPDSTLAALIALEKAEQVHLLTFHHNKMGKIGKHRIVADEMREKFGSNRVISYEETIDENFRKFYSNDFKKLFKKYRTFYIPWICGACKLSMHSSAIRYNLRNNVNVLYDGANRESNPYFVDQTNIYINIMKDFFKINYSMEYDCPVYNIDNTDVETEKYGLNTTKDTKKEHFVFSTQHTCLNGVLVHIHSRLYYRPLRGKDRTEKLGGEFLKYMLKNYKSLFPDNK